MDIQQTIIDDIYADLEDYLHSNPKINITIDKTNDDDYYTEGLHCSGIGSCKRKEVMSYFNFDKKPHNLQTMLTFMRGNFYHELIYQWLEQSSLFLINEKELDVSNLLPKPFRGKFDVCFIHRPTNKFILADIKTANSNQFKVYSKTLPKDNHKMQLSAYASVFKAWDYLLMMYFSSGSDKPRLFVIDYMKDINDIMNKYIEAVNKYKDTKELPPVLDKMFAEKEIWQCSYCDYKDISCEGYK